MPPPQFNPPDDPGEAGEAKTEPASLFGLFLLALVFVAAGLMLIALSGHGPAMLIGWVVAGIGGVILQVGIIAAGVELGVRRAHGL